MTSRDAFDHLADVFNATAEQAADFKYAIQALHKEGVIWRYRGQVWSEGGYSSLPLEDERATRIILQVIGGKDA